MTSILKLYWKKLNSEQQILCSAALISLVSVLVYTQLQASDGDVGSPDENRRPVSVDTMIPRGFVLVPIEVENYEALDSILGRFGVVDLFQRQVLVARNVRILRAPQNPAHYAILVREGQVKQVLQNGSTFLVVIKPPEKDGTVFVKQKPSKRRKIVYEGG